MATTKTTEKEKTDTLKDAPPVQLPAAMALRLPYPKSLQDWAGYDQRDWQVLTDVIFPTATTVNAIILAVEYCKSRKLDIMKKVVHIVPMRRKIAGSDNKYEMVDTIWPGIAEVRITATRTGVYAGKDAAVFGPGMEKEFKHVDTRNGEETVKKRETVEFPEWCRVDVYKIVQGQRCKFEGPKVYWEEAYATESFFSEIPNEMWKSRRSGQLEKCAEAAALRAAFPEELGGEYTAEEMHSRNVIEGTLTAPQAPQSSDILTPPRPRESDFQRQEPPKTEPKLKQSPPASSSAPDGRPEPPPLGEEVGQAGSPGGGPQGPRDEDGQIEPEPQTESAPEPSEAYMAVTTAFDADAETITGVKDLDAYKREGRAKIDNLDGVTDDERDLLRAKFTTMVLTEQQRRAKKGKR